jgi:GntR family transcriptional regulator
MKKTGVRRKSPAASRVPAREAHHVLPLHHRIYVVLRRRLTDGEYPPQRPIPGEHQLAKDFAASRVTIRRVLEQLDNEGLVDRRHGAGTYPRAAATGGGQTQTSYSDYIAASGHGYDDSLIEFAHIPTPGFLDAIGADFGAVVLKIVRVAKRGGVACHILSTYIPADLAEHVSRRAIGNKTVLELLKKHAIQPEESELKITAVAADTFEAGHLRVAVGSPLVHAIRISRLAGGRAIEYQEMHSVADIFGYRFLVDWRTGGVRLPPLK